MTLRFRSRSVSHIALALAFVLSRAAADFTVTVATYPAGGTLSGQPSHSSVSNYGNKPMVLLNAKPGGGYDVAWHINSLSKIRILPFDSAGKPQAPLQPDSIVGAKNLLGLARIPDDGGLAVIYAKDSPHSGSAYEFWCTRVDAAGQKVFSKMVFGDAKSDLVDAKGEPGTFSSGRMVYNPATKKLALYVGHTMKWDDGVRHQAGFMAFMGLDGAFGVANGWYSSHNFDQRLMLVGNDYFTLAHGDAYPRALGFAKWSDAGAKGSQVFDKQFLKIPGAVGDNKTSTQLGGFVSFPDGTFGVVFTTANGRNAFDVGYRQLSAKGDTLGLNWITAYPAATFALYPKIARLGDNVLLMWEEVSGTANGGIRTAVVSPAGAIVAPNKALADKSLRLSPFYEPASLGNGIVMWANQKGNDSISVFRLAEVGSPVKSRLADSKPASRSAAGAYPRFDSRGKRAPAARRNYPTWSR